MSDLDVAGGLAARGVPERSWVHSFKSIEEAAAGHLSLFRHEHEVPCRLTAAERREIEAAKKRGYLISRGGRYNLSNIWFRWCDTACHPYVVTRPRRTVVTVEMDLIAYPYIDQGPNRLTDEGVQSLCALLHSVPARNGHGISWGDPFSYHSAVLPEAVPGLVRAMLEIVAKHGAPILPLVTNQGPDVP